MVSPTPARTRRLRARERSPAQAARCPRRTLPRRCGALHRHPGVQLRRPSARDANQPDLDPCITSSRTTRSSATMTVPASQAGRRVPAAAHDPRTPAAPPWRQRPARSIRPPRVTHPEGPHLEPPPRAARLHRPTVRRVPNRKPPPSRHSKRTHDEKRRVLLHAGPLQSSERPHFRRR
jgi:hypothetical protein